MKLSLIFLGVVLVGCSHSLPPKPPIVVEVRPLPIPRVKGQMVSVEIIEPPIKTWLSKDELDQLRLQQAMEKAVAEDPCQPGDPLCEHIR